ncbi:MAG: hypothetical protein ACRENS_13930, partial [Candidatus Eiseniibacteriota bacterium]
ALEAPPAHAGRGGDERGEGEREGGACGSGSAEAMLARMTRFFHANEVDGVTPDPRIAINPSEASRLGIVSQLLGFNQMARIHPSPAARQDVADRADFLVQHFYELTSGSAFDGMTGYALLGAYEVTRDPRYLEQGRIVVDRCLALSGWNNTLNWGLMSALALSKYYDLTGDPAARDKTLEIIGSLAPYQNSDGSFPHYCPGSVDIHYTDWMSMELLIVRRWVPSPLIDQYLAGTRRFLEECIDSTGVTSYQVPCPSCPGGWRYRFGLRSGCYIDYDTRGWVNELGYSALLFGELRSPRFAPVMAALGGMETDGAFADKFDFFPPSYDPIYPWATANPSVIRTSVVFWSLAELEADRLAPALANHHGDDDDEQEDPDRAEPLALREGGSGTALSIAPPRATTPHSAGFGVASQESLMLAVVRGRELGAPNLAPSGISGDASAPGDLPRHGGALHETASSTGGAAEARALPAAGSAAQAPGVTRIERIAPNPARHGCEIAFSLARAGDARLEIFDVAGRRVRSLESGTLAAGSHQARWDGR